ncbi:MAG TPA: hypothetical protein VG144_13485 [Gaiellaceae bacterium]|nr:hypothetical protein [Gaiellaceae bacterium]
MSDRIGEEPPTPAEQRLAALLALLRSDLVRSRPGLATAIMRSVRWQGLLRDMADALGTFASSVVRGLGILLGHSRGPGERR